MGVAFNKITVGSEWDRKELADLWGYQSFHAFGRGVFTPQNDNKIVLFVKEQKRVEDEQYDDRLIGNLLHWHGEKGHGADHRIAQAHQCGDEIHVFYRPSHREPFRYLGRARSKRAEFLSNEPSRFVLELLDWPKQQPS